MTTLLYFITSLSGCILGTLITLIITYKKVRNL